MPVVPAPVLAEARGGGRQASLARLLAMCQIEPMTEAKARTLACEQATPGTTTPWT